MLFIFSFVFSMLVYISLGWSVFGDLFIFVGASLFRLLLPTVGSSGGPVYILQPKVVAGFPEHLKPSAFNNPYSVHIHPGVVDPTLIYTIEFSFKTRSELSPETLALLDEAYRMTLIGLDERVDGAGAPTNNALGGAGTANAVILNNLPAVVYNQIGGTTPKVLDALAPNIPLSDFVREVINYESLEGGYI